MPETATDNVVLGPNGEKIIETWWVNTPANRLMFEVFYVRYHERVKQDPEDDESKDYWAPWQECLSPEGVWKVVPEGGECQPTLTLPDRLVWAMSQTTGPLQLNKKDIGEALRKLVVEIVIGLDKKLKEAK